MGLFDLPAPIFSAIDGVLSIVMPAVLRLAIWGTFAGWLSMFFYRLFSNQEKIGGLKAQQKKSQIEIAEFDGEFSELMPLIRHTLALGFRQLGHALGPALLATIPVLFIIIWVAGEFGYRTPAAGSEVILTVEPASSDIQLSPKPDVSAGNIRNEEGEWKIVWPSKEESLTISDEGQPLLTLPLERDIAIIHKKKWWNVLMANPLGYLPQDGKTDAIHIHLPETVFIPLGPNWVRGWMFSFFMVFLLSSIVFKRLLRLD
jgi:hypothetical protein